MIEVDESKFADLAERFGITPEEAARIVLGKIDDLRRAVGRASNNQSLDRALGTLFGCSEIVYAWDRAIKSVVGDSKCVGNRRYGVEEADVDLDEYYVWYEVCSMQGDDSEIDSMGLYFGKNAGEVVRASMCVELDGGKIGDDVLEEIINLIDSAVPENNNPPDFEYDCDEERLSFEITIHTDRNFVQFKPDVPTFDKANELVREIKEIISRYANAQAGHAARASRS